jgi:DNA-binding transcriptional MerR regulator
LLLSHKYDNFGCEGLIRVKEFLSVNEFSKLSGIEKTTLRYWDEIGLFVPAKRDKENKYRYYSPEQTIAVNFISVLSDLNVPLKIIGAEADNRTPESIVRLIEQQEARLGIDLRRLQECYSVMHKRLEFIRFGLRLLDSRVDPVAAETGVPPISVQNRPEIEYILGPRNHYAEGEEFYVAFMNFCKQSNDLRVNLNYPIAGYHESMEAFLAEPNRPIRFISMDPSGNRRAPAGEYLCGYARGYYGHFGDLPQQMSDYAKSHGLKLTGPAFTIYLHDEICMKEPSDYLAQICVGIE